MKTIFVLVSTLFFFSCQNSKQIDLPVRINWEIREAKASSFESFKKGKTYLPVYSHIYHRYELRTFSLTSTVSIHNISQKDTLYILKADYYNTAGKKIREYLTFSVYVLPLETVEIVIEEYDIEGGSGANFIFDWAVKNEKNPPLFESIMISTAGQQGLSFTSRGVNIYD